MEITFVKRNHIKIGVQIYLFIVNLFRVVRVLDKEVYKLSMKEFSDEINRMPYKADPLGGLIDNVADPETFFDDKDSGRDCDDWARQWSIWGVNNGYKAYEYVVWNPSSLMKAFNTMHVITILKKEDECYLMNYTPYGPFSDEECCIDFMKRFKSYVDDMDYTLSREIKKEVI